MGELLLYFRMLWLHLKYIVLHIKRNVGVKGAQSEASDPLLDCAIPIPLAGRHGNTQTNKQVIFVITYDATKDM